MNTRHGWVASRALTSRFRPAVALPMLAALALAGCTSNSADGASKIAVTLTDDACTLSATQAPAGNSVFTVTNSGSKVAEFYVYAADGTKIVAEVENVGPGLSRDLVLTLSAGTYVTSCDPGMDGNDIRADFTVTGDGQAAAPTGEHAAALEAASAKFLFYVQDEVDQLVVKTQAFTDHHLWLWAWHVHQERQGPLWHLGHDARPAPGPAALLG